MTLHDIQEIVGDEDFVQACIEATEQLQDGVANNRPTSLMTSPRVDERRRTRHEKTINAVVDFIYKQSIMFAPCVAQTMEVDSHDPHAQPK